MKIKYLFVLFIFLVTWVQAQERVLVYKCDTCVVVQSTGALPVGEFKTDLIVTSFTVRGIYIAPHLILAVREGVQSNIPDRMVSVDGAIAEVVYERKDSNVVIIWSSLAGSVSELNLTTLQNLIGKITFPYRKGIFSKLGLVDENPIEVKLNFDEVLNALLDVKGSKIKCLKSKKKIPIVKAVPVEGEFNRFISKDAQ